MQAPSVPAPIRRPATVPLTHAVEDTPTGNKCACAGISDRSGQRATLSEHLRQASSSGTQAPSAHQRGSWILRH